MAATQNPEAAQQFVDFLLAEEAQTYFGTETFEFPLIEGVPQPDGVPPLSEIAAPDIDLSELAGVLDLATSLVAEAGLCELTAGPLTTRRPRSPVRHPGGWGWWVAAGIAFFSPHSFLRSASCSRSSGPGRPWRCLPGSPS